MKLHMIINNNVSKKLFQTCLTIFKNYFFKNSPLYSTLGMPLVVYMVLEKHGTVLFYCILVAYLIHMYQ